MTALRESFTQPISKAFADWFNLNAKWKADDTNDKMTTMYGNEL